MKGQSPEVDLRMKTAIPLATLISIAASAAIAPALQEAVQFPRPFL